MKFSQLRPRPTSNPSRWDEKTVRFMVKIVDYQFQNIYDNEDGILN